MVGYRFPILCLFFLFFLSLLAAQDVVVVDASIDQNQGIADQPLTGTVTVTHPRQLTIDVGSFRLEGKPLNATLTEEVSISPGKMGTAISIYQFQLPAKSKGLYTLAPIAVTVGGKVYQSIASAYEVRARTTISTPLSQTSSSSPIIFKLEALVQGPSPLYPGQKAKLIYRITYNRSIDLSYSDLPLLHTQEFQKIGDEQIKDYQQGDLTYQDITQEIQAFKIGAFRYSPSLIEGYAYTINQLGQKVYLSNKLSAESAPVEVVVSPFPVMNQPASFNGTVGKLNIALKMLSPSEVVLGDPIELELEVSGPTNLADMHLPPLQCQPGFSGFFQLNDLPPVASIQNGIKYFKVELRPISLFVKAIPSIEISSFNPQTMSYDMWHSDALPLKVKKPSLPTEMQIPSSKPELTSQPLPFIWKEPNIPLPPIEIQGNQVTLVDLKTNWLATSWVLGIAPLGLALLILQKYGHQKWKTEKKSAELVTSEELLSRALNNQINITQIHRLHLIKAAFLARLKEKNYLASQEDSLDNLPETGIGKDVKTFIFSLESIQYGLTPTFNLEQIRGQAETLFKLI